MHIPEAVRASVIVRLETLDRSERDTILRASVIGRRFDVALLVATARISAARVTLALEHACALQLIVAEDDTYERFAFRHALTRDIVYAELIAPRSRRLHLRVGDTLERKSLEQNPALLELAHHFWLAGDRERASRFNEIAGDRAAAVHATADARTYYERAHSVVPVASPAYERLARKLKALKKKP